MKDSLASRLSQLASDAESLAETIRSSDADVPPERTRRRAHQLRETFGTALILRNACAGDRQRPDGRDEGTL